MEGLGRDPDFDSQSDSYPRVQVGRLRKMLDAHYLANPPHDGVQLHIRPGSYRVHLIQPEAAAAPWPGQPERGEELGARSLIAEGLRRSPPPLATSAPFPWRLAGIGLVLFAALLALIWIVGRAADQRAPVRMASQAPVLELGTFTPNGGREAQTLATSVQTLFEGVLHHSPLIRVRESQPTNARDLADVDEPVYRLTGRVDTSGALGGARVVVSLLHIRSRDQLWSAIITVAPGQTLQDSMRSAMIDLIKPFGVIGTHQRGLVQPEGKPGYACLLEYETYRRHRDPNLARKVRECVDATVAAEPTNAQALAAASTLRLDARLVQNAAELTEGAELARRAVAADPNSAEAQVADLRVAIIGGHCARGHEIGLRAESLNPYNPELVGLAGYMLSSCNDPVGLTLLQRAMMDDPDLPSFYSLGLMIGLLERGDTQAAVKVAETMRPPSQGTARQYEIAQTLARAALGDIPGAKKRWAMAEKITEENEGPTYAAQARYFYVRSFRTRLQSYLQQKGVIGGAPATRTEGAWPKPGTPVSRHQKKSWITSTT